MNDFLAIRHPLSLHHLTALDATPAELAGIAGELGCRHVGLFAYVPPAARHVYPVIAAGDVAAVRTALDAAGVSLCNLEVFPLDAAPDWTGFEAALAVGAALGATRATAHIHEADEPAAIERFARFCALAAGFGITAGLEFNAFSAVTAIAPAARIVRATNASLVCDMLHLFRSGDSAAAIATAADLIGYAQLSDGPADCPAATRWHEAVRERALPGDGAFALGEALAALRPGTVIEVEVPQTAARKAGVPAAERARRAVEASRRLLARVAAEERVS